jgi:hypothetical protein
MDEDTATFQRLLLMFDTPAYLRRAQGVEAEWNHIVANCRREFDRQLELPRLRLARLRALSANFTRYAGALGGGERRDWLGQLDAAWRPELRTRVRPAARPEEVSAALAELLDSIGRFNSRWLRYVNAYDLGPVNRAREGYNEYYVLEKECATRSLPTARQDFEELPPVTPADLLREFPPLDIPAT